MPYTDTGGNPCTRHHQRDHHPSTIPCSRPSRPHPATIDVPAQVATETLVVTDDEVADLEHQLDEIDQLLAGVDADLSQD